ncbi:MAG: hypothetical protein V3V05_06060 [Pontiella sp.]
MSFPIAPSAFEGSLEELYENHAKQILPAPHIVEVFHKKLCAYMDEPDPLFLTRKVGQQKQGEDLRINGGSRIRASDNSPAWWIQYHLFHQTAGELDDFPVFIDSAPCQMFRVQLPETLNGAGWHVAPIFNVNNDHVNFMDWSRADLIGRCIRNIHPCNYFYIPKTEWKKHAGQAEVLTFFQEKYATLYASIWDEFLQLAEASPHEPIDASGTYAFTASTRKKQSNKLLYNGIECATSYEDFRLSFNAKSIEPLEMNQRFCIVTPNIYYIMTKREFYENFADIVKPGSCYRTTGLYYFRSPPQRARPFMIERSTS